MSPAWNVSSWTMEMDGPLGKENYVYNWTMNNDRDYKNLINGGTDFMILEFNCDQELYGSQRERVSINFNYDQRIQVLSF